MLITRKSKSGKWKHLGQVSLGKWPTTEKVFVIRKKVKPCERKKT